MSSFRIPSHGNDTLIHSKGRTIYDPHLASLNEALTEPLMMGSAGRNSGDGATPDDDDDVRAAAGDRDAAQPSAGLLKGDGAALRAGDGFAE